MKAALEAWGAGSNLFHQGVAKETDDPEVVTATMSKPGVVLRRPAGSTGRFAEHSELPNELVEHRPRQKREKKATKISLPNISEKAATKAALEFERAQGRRDAERRRQEAAFARERERREKAITKAQAAIDEAKEEHEAQASAIEAERAAIEKRAEDEDVRWKKLRDKLEADLRRAREYRRF